jgi:hypothetical protein
LFGLGMARAEGGDPFPVAGVLNCPILLSLGKGALKAFPLEDRPETPTSLILGRAPGIRDYP